MRRWITCYMVGQRARSFHVPWRHRSQAFLHRDTDKPGIECWSYLWSQRSETDIIHYICAITCCCSSILLFALWVKATAARNFFLYQNCLLCLLCAIPLDITRGCKTSSSIISLWTSLLETQQANQIRAALLSGGMSNSIMCSSAACRVHAMCSSPTSSGFVVFLLFIFLTQTLFFCHGNKTIWLIFIVNQPFQLLSEEKQ